MVLSNFYNASIYDTEGRRLGAMIIQVQQPINNVAIVNQVAQCTVVTHNNLFPMLVPGVFASNLENSGKGDLPLNISNRPEIDEVIEAIKIAFNTPTNVDIHQFK